MKTKIGSEALIPNPGLEPFNILIGKWKTEGSHPYIPGVILHGRTSFEWMEGGSFILMHSEIDEERIPSGIAILGSDDAIKKFFMLYFDERGVSRKYDVSLTKNKLTWWRDDPSFSQRFTILIEKDKMIGTGEMSKEKGSWEKDLSLIFSRIEK